jgi:hypothetical protein
MGVAITTHLPSAGPDSLGSHGIHEAQASSAAEGQADRDHHRSATQCSPVPVTTSLQAIDSAMPTEAPPAGSKTSHGHHATDTQGGSAVAASIPGGQRRNGTHRLLATGDSDPGQPAANLGTMPIFGALLADPLLALAADVLDDLERVRIANENRLRQLTRGEDEPDKDGETGRGFGLDESHPDVARLAALVAMVADAEHKAELNLGRLMRANPLGPWVKATHGIGPKQGARLIAAIGDPYIRPEIVREDGTVEPSRPRTVSELWAYTGYHVIRIPVSGHSLVNVQHNNAADGPDFPVGHMHADAQPGSAGGEHAGHPGHTRGDDQELSAGMAPKRARGQKANWSATAKMRAYLVAVSCMKNLDSPYRKIYDDTREKYADAVHQFPCIRCGPSGKPAQPGTPLSDGHKHARALRKVAKEVLKDLWREARRLHEEGQGAPAREGNRHAGSGA